MNPSSSQNDEDSNWQWIVMAVTTVVALAITMLTVSYQAVKAALMNPFKSLRSK